MSAISERYFDDDRTMAIALALAERPSTLYETATRIGLRSGDIRRRVHQMYSDGVVSADPEPPRKGSVFRLRDEVAAILEAAISKNQPSGVCRPGQRVLEVTVGELTAFYSVFERRDLAAIVVWAVEADGSGRSWLVLSDVASREQAELLQVALVQAGCEVTARRFGVVRSADEILAHAKSVAALRQQASMSKR